MQTHVKLSIENDIATLTFECDAAGKPATLDSLVLNELEHAITAVESQINEIRAVILRSAFPRYFVVGANINALQDLSAVTIAAWVNRGHQVFNRLEALPVPVIAIVQGYALGGGLELAMACDLIFASNDAKLGQPEANLGLVSGWGGSYRLPRRIGLAQAKLMFYTGRIIDASEALRLGLVDYVGDDDAVNAFLMQTLSQIRQCSPFAVAKMKLLLINGMSRTLTDNADDEAAASEACLREPDTQQRVRTYLESRKSKA